MAIRINANQQRETQLLMEWLLSLGKNSTWKTHVNVGAEILQYNGKPLTPAQQNAFGVWNSWADARVFTGTEVLLVEAKIVATGTAYGEILDYLDQYPSSTDYKQFSGFSIRGVVLAAYVKDRTRMLFSNYGIQTVIFTPVWASDTLSNKVFTGIGT
jgi:hypothetical protein